MLTTIDQFRHTHRLIVDVGADWATLDVPSYLCGQATGCSRRPNIQMRSQVQRRDN